MLFIVNPISGNGRKKHIVKEIKKRGYNVAFTEFPGHADEIAASSHEREIVAVGGDGTVNEIVRSLYGSGKVLGILPCGSGDGLQEGAQDPRRRPYQEYGHREAERQNIRIGVRSGL